MSRRHCYPLGLLVDVTSRHGWPRLQRPLADPGSAADMKVNRQVMRREPMRSSAIGLLETRVAQWDVAERFGDNRTTVFWWWRRHCEDKTLVDKKRSGRPSTVPVRVLSENLWAVMKESLDQQEPATSLGQREQRLKKAWIEISANTLHSLVASMPSRIQKCVQLRGDYVGCWIKSTAKRKCFKLGDSDVAKLLGHPVIINLTILYQKLLQKVDFGQNKPFRSPMAPQCKSFSDKLWLFHSVRAIIELPTAFPRRSSQV